MHIAQRPACPNPILQIRVLTFPPVIGGQLCELPALLASTTANDGFTVYRSIKAFYGWLQSIWKTKFASSAGSGFITSGAMQTPPWREASSLIIVCRASLSEKVGKNLPSVMGAAKFDSQDLDTSKCDYRLLMVKRSNLSSFMASAFVFPGGLVEVADYSPRWWSVFEAMGLSREEMINYCKATGGPRPAMVRDPLTLSNAGLSPDQHLPADIALRITAIRETFEECGLLLLTQPPQNGQVEAGHAATYLQDKGIDIASWREKVHDDPYQFLEFCHSVKMCPDIWALQEWWDWLTPISVGHRRYDTMFYMCCLDFRPEVAADQGEVVTLKWCTPEGMLENYCSGTAFLAPPQVYELSRMLHLNTYYRLQDFAISRGTKGIERWMPVLAIATDGVVSLLPGDDYYPQKPDYLGVMPSVDLPQGLDELRSRTHKLHRLEIRGPLSTVYCNVPLPCGHLQPVAYRGLQPIIQSML